MGSDFNPDGLIHCVLAIYALSCNDLLKAYRNTKSARSEKKRLQALAETKNLENWFMNDPYCVLSDPNRVIAGIKDRSRRKGNFHFEFTQRGISS